MSGFTKSVSFVVRISLENQEDIRERSSAGKFHSFYLLAGNVATGETYLKARSLSVYVITFCCPLVYPIRERLFRNFRNFID
jgi:hypothetical protein